MTTDTENIARSKRPRRPLHWVIVVVSFVFMLISMYLLAGRIERYNKAIDHPAIAFIDLTTTAFAFNNLAVELSEIKIDDEQKIHVRYGETTIDLDIAISPRYQLPTLFDRHSDWMKLLYFADRSGMTFREFREGIADATIEPRMIIVTRTPFGFEPVKEKRFENIETEKNWGWGEVMRDQWRFDFYEFMPDGQLLQHEPLRFPESGKSLLRRQNYAKLKGEQIPQRGEGEIEEYTWQFGAALSVSPRAPAVTFEKQALRGSGWTLPASAGGFLLMVVAFFFAIAPTRTQQETGA
ncbi:MAG: hypothetical protein JKY96_02620 [Phycisphaerales bacterium]|nr:hypothetical protein [Phycisphaerales bacterium]